jgi:hypothetical protein
MLSLKKSGKPLLSDRVLKLLAAAELPPQKQAYQQKLHELLGEVAMRREKKREEKERRFLSRQERLRERRQRKNTIPSLVACQPAGDDGSAIGERKLGMKLVAEHYLASGK